MNNFMVVLAAAILLAGCKQSPEAQAKSRARSAIDLCWKEQKRASNPPEQARFIAATCEKMEADFVEQYKVKP